MKWTRVNGQAEGRHAQVVGPASHVASRLALVAMLVGAAGGIVGCPTVQRYGPDDPAPASRRDPRGPKSPPGRTPSNRPGPGALNAGDGAALGDGTLSAELLSGARRVLGWRFARAGVDEVSAFLAHLKVVAVWEGSMESVADPRPGDLWVARGGRIAVVEATGGQGRVVVIGPRDGGSVQRYEVDGGSFKRATGAFNTM